MTERLRALKRVLAVQDRLKREADWRLAEAERAAAEAAEASRDLGRFIDGGDLAGALALAAMAQSRRLAARDAATARTVETEAQAMRDATARQKLVAKGVETLARQEAAARERKDLERLAEALAGRTLPGGSDA